jgi:tetratricopeptide (TPR) repeat protein
MLAEIQRLTGRAYTFLGRFTEAGANLTAALRAYQAAKASKLVGMAQEGLAGLRFASGDVDGARPLYAQALATFKVCGASRSISVVATNLAEAEFRAGEIETALLHANDALTATRAQGDDRNIALGLANIMAYLCALGRAAEAREHAGEALEKARRCGDEIATAVILQHIAATHILDPTSADADCRLAMTLVGYVDLRLQAMGEPREYTEQFEYHAIVRSLDARYGNSVLEELRTGGHLNADDAAASARRLIER